MMNIEYIKTHKKGILIGIFLLLVIGIGYYIYAVNKPLPITAIDSVNPTNITKALPSLGIQPTPTLVKEIVTTIEHRVQSEPDVVYVTQTQAQADKQADKIAKQDKADAIIKETKDNVTNNYYGIHLEKNNSVGIGGSVIDGKVYLSAAYERTINKDKQITAEVIIHSKDLKNIDGGTVLVKKKF